MRGVLFSILGMLIVSTPVFASGWLQIGPCTQCEPYLFGEPGYTAETDGRYVGSSPALNGYA